MSRFEEVSRVLHRYVRALDDRRLDDLMDLFCEDATLDGVQSVRGRADLRVYFEGWFSSSWTSSTHFVANLIVDEVDAENASAACDYFQTAVVNGRTVFGWGRYDDTFRLEGDGSWRFATRRNQVRGHLELSAQGSLGPINALAEHWRDYQSPT